MKHRLLFLLLLIPFLFSSQQLSASHLMGGDLTYKHLGDSTYEITFLVYRDCNNGSAAIDRTLTYWVYEKSTKDVFINHRQIPLFNNTTNLVKPEAPNCVSPSGVCIESGTYIDTVVLGGDPGGYIVNWYRRARNYNILNLRRCKASSVNTSCNSSGCNQQNPFSMVWTAEIPSYKFNNSSPQFLTVPVPYFCTGITNSFNHVVFDPDGDSLVFKIVTPLSPDECLPVLPAPSNTNPAPSYSDVYKNVTYQSGYSVSKPFGASSSAISINSTTGEMKANPSTAGAYVIAVKIEEYRVDPITKKSTYLGSVRRDLQFIAGNCPSISNTPPYFTKSGSSVITVSPFDTIKFDIEIADNSDSVYMSANGNIFGVDGSTLPKPHASFPDTRGKKSASQEFFWVPTCDHITYTSPHIFTVNISDDGCNQLQKTYTIFVKGRTIYQPPAVKCLDVASNTSIKVTWDTLKNVQFFNGLFLYRVDAAGVTKKVASFTDSTKVDYTDNSVTNALSSAYRYYLRIENSCGLEGFRSDSLSTFFLKQKEIDDKTVEFSWGSYGGGPFRYILQQKQGTGFVDVDSTHLLKLDYKSCNLLGDFRVKVVDSTNSGYCSLLTNEVTSTTKDVTPPVGAPVLNGVSVLDWGKNQVSFKKSSSPDADQYGIYRAVNGGSFSSVGTIKSSQNNITYVDAASLTTNGLSYCYRVEAQDSCGNVGDESKMHCTVNLKSQSGQRENKLRWNKYFGAAIDSQTIERYDTLGKKWFRVNSVGSADSLYKDPKDVLCGYTYTYRLKTWLDAFPPYFVYSDSTIVKAKDTIAAPAIDVLYTTNIDDTTTFISFLKSTSSDVKDYLVIALEYDNNVLVNTDIHNHSSTKDDTIKLSIKTLKATTRSYCFSVIAVDSCGQNFSSNDDVHCPVFLDGTALNLGNRLNWTLYDGLNVDSNIIEINDNGIWKPLDRLNKTTRSMTYNGLPCKQPYEYRIKSKIKGSTLEVYSNAQTVTPFDTIKPDAPYVHFTTVTEDTAITIEWAQSAANDVVQYNIYSSKNGDPYSLIDSIPRSIKLLETYVHNGITAQEDTFSYRIIALDSCSSLNLSVNNVRQDAIQLKGEGANQENKISWVDYLGFDVDAYEIESYDLATSTWTTIKTVPETQTTFVDEDLYCFDTVTYRIKALDANSAFFAYSDTIRLKPFDTISPVAPIIKSVSVTALNEITVAWNASPSLDVLKYVVYRKGPNTAYQILDTVLRQFSYVDNQATDSIYTYSLIAIDSCTENSSFKKSEFENSLLLTSSRVKCQGQFELEWNPYLTFDKGLLEYEVYRSTDGNPEKKIATLSAATLNYIDNISQHHNYVYRVNAVETGRINEASSQKLEADIYITPQPQLYTASITQSDIANGEIDLYWQKQDGVSLVEYSKLYYKESTHGTYTLLKDNISLKDSSFTHTGLNTKTGNHQYFLVNVDSCGITSDTLAIHQTMDMTFGYGQLEHDLNWTAYQGLDAQMYILQQLLGGSYVDIDTIGAADNKFTRFPAPCNTVITYRIAVVDSFGNQAYSDTTSGTALDLLAPDAPTISNLTVIDNHHVQVDFEGVDSLDTYGFSLDRSNLGFPYVQRGFIPFTVVHQIDTFRDTTNFIGKHYTYKVVALDSCLNASPSSLFQPIGLGGNPGNFENHLTWHPYTGYLLDKYYVEQFISGTWQTIVTLDPSDTAYTHKNIGCNTALLYRVKGIEDGGTRITYSNWIELTPFDTIAPAKPSFYTASAQSDKLLDLSWSYDNTSDIKFYYIYKMDDLGAFQALDTVTRTDTYTDTVADATHSIYEYKIVAVDSCSALHISPESDTVSNFNFTFKTDTCDPTTYLNWSKPKGLAEGIDLYSISKSNNGVDFRIIDSVVAPIQDYADTNVVSGKTYSYRITAINSSLGRQSHTDSISFLQRVRKLSIAPNVIRSTVIKSDENTGEVDLIWNEISRKEDLYITGYRLYYTDTVTKPYQLLASFPTLNDTSYVHITNTKSKYGYYRVTGVNTCSLSGDSSWLNAPVQLEVENLNLSSNLSWSEYYGYPVKGYDIYSDVEGAGFKKIASVSSNIFKYQDSTVGCGDSIAFYVEAISNDGILSRSDIESVIGFDTTLPKPTTINFLNVVSNKEIYIDWNASASKDASFYTITYKRFNDNKWDTLVDNVTALNYTDNAWIAPYSNTYEYRVHVTDSCGNVQPKASPKHHHIPLEAVKIGPNISLTWMNYRGWPVERFDIYRDNQVLHSITVDNSRSDSIFNYLDTSIGCDTAVYAYYIQAVNNSLTLTSNSTQDTAIGIDKGVPPSVYLASASVLIGNDGVRLRWDKSSAGDIKYYSILRKKNENDSFEIIKNVPSDYLTTIDTLDLNDDRSRYCYKVSVQDKCANLGVFSNEGCIMNLNGGNLSGANSIKWDRYTYWEDSVDYYEVYRSYDSVNFEFLTKLDKRANAFVDTNLNDTFFTYCYRVKAIEKEGGHEEVVWSTVLCATQEPLIFIANAFSPEVSLGLNDAFGPKGSFVPDDYTMQIYSRWGQIIYETHDGTPWDGRTVDQEFVPIGNYFYQIKMTTRNGKTYNRSGNVHIIR